MSERRLRSWAWACGAAVVPALCLVSPSAGAHHDEGTGAHHDEGAPRGGASAVLAPREGAAAPREAASAQPARAVDAEVMVLLATNKPGAGTGIDPRIGALPALKKPPFSSYNSYELLSRSRYPVSKSAPATSSLPNGRVVQVTLRDVLPENRYRIATSINQPGGTTFLPLLEVTASAGEPFFVAGQSYKGGTLVIGITVLK